MSKLNSTDKSLLERLNNDDKSAFGLIYNNYYEKLCLYVCSFSANDSQAEDIVQEVLLKLWENRESLIIHTSLNSYLYKAVYYKYINHYRDKKKQLKKLEEIRWSMINQLTEEKDDFFEQKLALINSAIEELPPKRKEVFLLSKVQGYKYREIAEILNISINTVEVHMGNALKALRTKLVEKKNQIINLFISLTNHSHFKKFTNNN